MFQKPNPLLAMPIYDNVVAGLKLAGQRVGRAETPRSGVSAVAARWRAWDGLRSAMLPRST